VVGEELGMKDARRCTAIIYCVSFFGKILFPDTVIELSACCRGPKEFRFDWPVHRRIAVPVVC